MSKDHVDRIIEKILSLENFGTFHNQQCELQHDLRKKDQTITDDFVK